MLSCALSWPSNWPQLNVTICFHIGNNVFVVAHLCCTSFLKLFSHTIAATQSKIRTIEKMSFTLNCIQSRVIRESGMRQWTGSGDCQRCNIATQEIGLDLSWLCGLLLSVIPPNIDTKQRPGSSLTIGTRCLKYCQSWVLIRAWDVSYTRDGPESQTSANIHNLDSHTLMASFRIS